jgi:AsmA protein
VLAGRGSDMAAIQRSLSGDMSIELKDGSFIGTDVWYELRRARALLKGEAAPEAVLPAKTEFSTVRMTGVMTDGVLDNDDLFAELPFMQLTGSGQVDIPAGTVDYRMTARILERPEFLQGATPEELDEFTEAVIPLKITGPLVSPSIQPDLEKLLQKRVEEEIKDKLKDKLKGLFD